MYFAPPAGQIKIWFFAPLCPFYLNCNISHMFPVVSVTLHGGCGDGGECGGVVIVVVVVVMVVLVGVVVVSVVVGYWWCSRGGEGGGDGSL